MKITLRNVTKKYGATVAVDDFSASLPDGHLICLLGPSGCGKSTLLNMLCGIVEPTAGQILFDDEDVTKLPPDRRNIGMVFQNYALYPHLTVLDNIAFPLEVQKVPRVERRKKAEEIAALVHVDTLLKRYPGELSGGQQQRVAIARALIKNPRLLLMDEPLSNLDARLRLEMREEIRRIQQETGVTTIFVTHDQEEAMSISDSILLMKDGTLVQTSTCQELYENPNSQFVADFIGNPPINVFPRGTLDTNKNHPVYKLSSGVEIPLPLNFENLSFEGKNPRLSIRAESFVFADDSEEGFEASVCRISLLGKEQIVYADIGGFEARTLLDSEMSLKKGDRIHLRLKKKGVFLFDSETGERLA